MESQNTEEELPSSPCLYVCFRMYFEYSINYNIININLIFFIKQNSVYESLGLKLKISMG